MPVKHRQYNRLVYLLLLILVCLSGTYVRYSVAVKHIFPEGDEGPWLRMAARSGTDEFLVSNVIEHDLYKKRTLPHPEDNRSPLFPLLLSVGKIFTDNTFRAAQVINLSLYLTCILLSGILLGNHISKRAMLLFLLFISVSPIFIINTAHIYNDVTVAFCFFFGIYAAETVPHNKSTAFLAGLACGLFFLLKISAVFLIPVFLVSFLKHVKNPRKILPTAFLFCLPFIFSAMPWMLRNIHLFGSPFHQFTGYAMWTNSMKEVFSVNIPTPSFLAYIETHGVFFTLFIRPVIGFKNLIFQLLTHDHHLSLFLLPCAFFGIRRTRGMFRLHRNMLIFSVHYLGLMSFVAYGFWVDRYLLVYYLYLYFIAAAGMVSVAENISEYLSGRFKGNTPRIPHVRLLLQTGVLFLLFIAPLSQIIYPLEFYLSPRGSEKSRDADARAIIAELQLIVGENESVFSSFLSGYSFLHNIQTVNTIHVGNAENFSLLENTYTIRYALLDTSSDHKELEVLPEYIAPDTLTEITKKGSFILYRIDEIKTSDT